MKLLWFDAETYYDDLYTLKKMTPVEYVLDPRFEMLGASFLTATGTPHWVDGPAIPQYLDGIDWADTMLVSHNMLFDGCILRWKYQKKPKMYGDTLAMARAWTYHLNGKASLDAVAAACKLPAKGKAILKMKGVTYQMLRQSSALYAEFTDYGRHDAWLCREAFKYMLADGFPISQLEIVDMQVRMACDPRFEFDTTILAEHLAQVQAEKAQLLAAADLTNGDDLMSNEKFAIMLQAEGVDPPTKKSLTTGKTTWSFSKQDKNFTSLLEHESPRVQAIAAARLGVKSTLEESRTQTFLQIASMTASAPIPLKFSGAHTHRFSGDWSLNMQNLGRKSRLRFALRAPKGWKVVSADAAQIEARLTALLCGQKGLVEQFARRDDVYARFAEQIFSHKVTKETHPVQRFIGKTAVLSLGYGSGWATFANMCRVQSADMPEPVHLSEEEARRVVNVYRNANDKIAATWERLDGWISDMSDPEFRRKFGPVEMRGHVAHLPTGLRLYYRDIHQGDRYGRVQWFYNWGRFEKVLYGPKLLENFIQALAFVLVMEAARRVKARSNGFLMPSHQVHDQLIYVVPEQYADSVVKLVVEEMTRPPEWAPDLPLAADPGIGDSYGELK